MRKWISLLLTLALVMTFGSAMAAMTPGTYSAAADGNNGPVKVEVTVDENVIVDVKVVEHGETAGISDAAIANIPVKIVETQSLAVDTVSGATNSSNAILTAVEDCLTQAGADVAAFKNADAAAAKEKEAKTLDTQLVIVGGGAAGMTAAIRARELGLDVVVLEKMSFMGGAISVSGGNQVVMGSELQKQAGVTDDTAESMVADFMANGANLNVPELIQLYADNVGPVTDWLNQYAGVQYDMEGGLHKLAEYSHDRELAYVGGGAGGAQFLRDAVEKSGATVLLGTRANQIVMKDGAACGVVAESDDAVYTISAKAVLLASGGYGNNKDLLGDEMKTALYYGPVSSTGDGIVMATAEDVGAATRLMEYGKRYPNGIEVSEGIAKSTIAGNIPAFAKSAILVNQEGSRVVNEKASNRAILTEELKQTGGMLYLVMDASTFDVWLDKLVVGGISEGDVTAWLEANGSSAPVFAHGDTLEEAAAVAGIDAAALKATVEKYNGFVDAGEDADFGRGASFLTEKIGEGPYYIVEQKPRFATTMGGLVVNTALEVANAEGASIPGLYAAGEIVGGVMGDDSPSGANNGWALTAGKLAADSIAAKLGE